MFSQSYYIYPLSNLLTVVLHVMTLQVKLEQGLEMLKIFKEHASKTSILDDFGFYENRQKLMQEKRAKQQQIQGQASITIVISLLWQLNL